MTNVHAVHKSKVHRDDFSDPVIVNKYEIAIPADDYAEVVDVSNPQENMKDLIEHAGLERPEGMLFRLDTEAPQQMYTVGEREPQSVGAASITVEFAQTRDDKSDDKSAHPEISYSPEVDVELNAEMPVLQNVEGMSFIEQGHKNCRSAFAESAVEQREHYAGLREEHDERQPRKRSCGRDGCETQFDLRSDNYVEGDDAHYCSIRCLNKEVGT